MKMKKYILLSIIFLAYFQLSADNLEPKNDIGQTCAYIHANIYSGGSVIKNAAMYVKNGVIEEVGTEVEIPAGTQLIDVKGKCIYPSFINAYSTLGLTEVFAVWQTIDGGEKEDFNPNIKAELAFNAESAHVPVSRANGIAYNVTVPMSGIIPGTSSLMKFKGWNWQEMLAKAPVSLILNWPTSASMTAFGSGPSLGGPSKIDQLYAFFEQAQAYLKADKADADLKYDARMQAMKPVLQGEVPVWVTANKVNDIQSVIAFADQYKLKVVIVGGLESLAFADLLKERNISVIVPNVFGMPNRTNPSFDAYFSLPSKLYEAGIPFCISVGGNMEVRNLPYHAGKASSYGLPLDIALKAITQYPANIIGVGDELGSLEKGKEASFILTDGNPLEISTKIFGMYIQGEKVSLQNKHKLLYEKYGARYNQK